MPRTKNEILRGLDPHDPATIEALIHFHRCTFGGWTMDVENGGQAGQGQQPGQESGQPGAPKPDSNGGKPAEGDQPGQKPGDQLGENGLKALQSERDARKELEAQLTQLKSGLAAALGVNEKDAKSSTDDIVANLQKQMADLNHSNLVLSVANEHKITDADDLALLQSITDETALRKLAARIKPSDDGAKGPEQKRRTPSPDPSQAHGGSSNNKPGDAGRSEAARRFKKQQ